MSHFLRHIPVRRFKLAESQTGVFVRVEEMTLHILPHGENTVRLEVGEVLGWLPHAFSIKGPGGESVRATGRFAITLQTHDPHHVVVDLTTWTPTV
ncbi:hypothetical protein N9917_00570 [Deltaproteobacteria bacterium]|nr:hypothetical protein [Deltaproteobacteria bacterium]